MKTILLSVLAMVMIHPSLWSNDGNENVDQQSIDVIDLSGTWVGSRSQFDKSGDDFIAEFDYMFELKQDGRMVSGISYIKNGDENFAEIKFKGRVVGNTLHFQEYEIVAERKPQDRLWCFKIGELNISKNNGVTTLDGNTKSYTSRYYIPCSGGFTSLERIDDYNNTTDEVTYSNNNSNGSEKNTPELSLNIYPNPFSVLTTVEYNLVENGKVEASLFNLEGRLIKHIINEDQSTGSYSLQIDAKQLKLAPGVYILEFRTGSTLYSKQLVVSGF